MRACRAWARALVRTLRTWILPGGRGELVEYLKRKRLKGYQKHGTIIYKPASGMQGTRIMLIQHEGNLTDRVRSCREEGRRGPGLHPSIVV